MVRTTTASAETAAKGMWSELSRRLLDILLSKRECIDVESLALVFERAWMVACASSCVSSWSRRMRIRSMRSCDAIDLLLARLPAAVWKSSFIIRGS